MPYKNGTSLYFYVYDIDEYKENPGLNIDLQTEMDRYAIKSAEILLFLCLAQTNCTGLLRAASNWWLWQ